MRDKMSALGVKCARTGTNRLIQVMTVGESHERNEEKGCSWSGSRQGKIVTSRVPSKPYETLNVSLHQRLPMLWSGSVPDLYIFSKAGRVFVRETGQNQNVSYNSRRDNRERRFCRNGGDVVQVDTGRRGFNAQAQGNRSDTRSMITR